MCCCRRNIAGLFFNKELPARSLSQIRFSFALLEQAEVVSQMVTIHSCFLCRFCQLQFLPVCQYNLVHSTKHTLKRVSTKARQANIPVATKLYSWLTKTNAYNRMPSIQKWNTSSRFWGKKKHTFSTFSGYSTQKKKKLSLIIGIIKPQKRMSKDKNKGNAKQNTLRPREKAFVNFHLQTV